MPFFKSMPDNAGPPTVFNTYPQIYGPWSQMSQALMNGPSPLSPAERELIFAYCAGAAGCEFVFAAHVEVAHAWGVEEGLIDKLLNNVDTAPLDAKLKALLRFAHKLTVTPAQMCQADADAVFDAGWDEQALHDAIAVSARVCFMQRLVEGHGFIPFSREVAKAHARKRVELGYLNLYPQLAKAMSHADQD